MGLGSKIKHGVKKATSSVTKPAKKVIGKAAEATGVSSVLGKTTSIFGLSGLSGLSLVGLGPMAILTIIGTMLSNNTGNRGLSLNNRALSQSISKYSGSAKSFNALKSDFKNYYKANVTDKNLLKNNNSMNYMC